MRLCIPLTAMLIYSAILSPASCNRNRETNDRSQTRSTARGSSPSMAAQEGATPSDGVRRISLAELRDALEKGEVVVLDVRGPVEYEMGHIKGARSMPLGLIAQQAAELPRDKLIVAYCA